jgi:hypothetical protein
MESILEGWLCVTALTTVVIDILSGNSVTGFIIQRVKTSDDG